MGSEFSSRDGFLLERRADGHDILTAPNGMSADLGREKTDEEFIEELRREGDPGELREFRRYLRHLAGLVRKRPADHMYETILGTPSSFSELTEVQAGCGPPPPPPLVSPRPTVSTMKMTTASKRWRKEAREWLSEKRARKKWLGRPGGDALTYLLRCAAHVARYAKEIEEPDLWVLVEKTMGPSGSAKHYCLSVLSSFLTWCGNPVIVSSGIRARFSRKPGTRPVVPSPEMARIQRLAERGEKRLTIALLRAGRRRVEIARARWPEDFHVEATPPTMDIRGKGGLGNVTGEPVPLPEFVLRPLREYLPLRRAKADGATFDSGHLICRKDGSLLVGVSCQHIDRLRKAALAKAACYWPGHAFRRGAATALAERGAQFEDISAALQQSSPEVTRGYVQGLVRQRRVAAALTLLSEPDDTETAADGA